MFDYLLSYIKYNILNEIKTNSKKYLSKSKKYFTFEIIKIIIMKSRYLFSHKLKPLGWILFSIGIVLGVILLINDFDFPNWKMNVFSLIGSDDSFSTTKMFSWVTNNISDEVVAILIIVGGILVSFSKTKEEDEYIAKIRMESLIWATYVNYLVLLLAVILVFDMAFFNVMIFNMFTILIFFILRFHYVLYKTKKTTEYEE